MPNLDNIISDPCWLPMGLDETYQKLSFARLERDALRAAPFLDARAVTSNTPQITLPVKDISQNIALAPFAMPPMIFHSAFCCSTLMAKALDKRDTCLALKEPDILMALANAKRMMQRANRPPSDFASLFKVVLGLLARPHKPGETVLIKATNSANNLLEDVSKTGSKILLMYSGLEDFLISVLKKGEACKSFIRTQYNIFTLDPGALSEIASRQAMTFTDLQVASLVWRHQLEIFGHYHRNKDIEALRDVAFLTDKPISLKLAISALGLTHTQTDIQVVMDSNVFAQDVKFENQTMNNDTRMEAAHKIRRRYSRDIDAALAWADSLNLGGDILPIT